MEKNSRPKEIVVGRGWDDDCVFPIYSLATSIFILETVIYSYCTVSNIVTLESLLSITRGENVEKFRLKIIEPLREI